MKGNFDWDRARIKKLTQFWNESLLSASEIAELMGETCTRNAVIGKARKLKLNPRRPGHRGATAMHSVEELNTRQTIIREVMKKTKPPTKLTSPLPKTWDKCCTK